MKTLSKLEKICQRCNKVYVDKAYNKTRKYCSNSCSASKPKVIIKCKFCKNKISKNKSSTKIFCSISCARKANPPVATDPIIILKRNIIIDEKTGCWLYQCLHMKGYGHLYIDGKKYPAHRFSYEYHNKPINNPLLYACHRCDVRNCVNPDHIFLGTAKENNRDKLNKGRSNPSHGENHSSSKLTELQVKQILQKLENGIQQKIIAKEYGVCPTAISRIKIGKSWKHVQY